MSRFLRGAKKVSFTLTGRLELLKSGRFCLMAAFVKRSTVQKTFGFEAVDTLLSGSVLTETFFARRLDSH